MRIDRNSEEVSKYLEKLNLNVYRDYQIEQVILRIYVCKNCLLEKKCKFCSCNPLDKIIEPISCNKVSPDFMTKEKWEIYKTTHNIEIL